MEQSLSVVNNTNNDLQCNVYPNPAKGYLNFEIENTNKPVQLKIYNLAGKLMYFQNIIERRFEWNTTDFHGNSCKPGMYIYKLSSGAQIKSGIFALL